MPIDPCEISHLVQSVARRGGSQSDLEHYILLEDSQRKIARIRLLASELAAAQSASDFSPDSAPPRATLRGLISLARQWLLSIRRALT